MSNEDVAAMVASGQTNAAAALVNMFREGLNNAVHIPEIITDAEDATHALLGCAWTEAMRVLIAAEADLPEDTPAPIRQCVLEVIDRQLGELARLAMVAGGPIGAHPCGWHVALDPGDQ